MLTTTTPEKREEEAESSAVVADRFSPATLAFRPEVQFRNRASSASLYIGLQFTLLHRVTQCTKAAVCLCHVSNHLQTPCPCHPYPRHPCELGS